VGHIARLTSRLSQYSDLVKVLQFHVAAGKNLYYADGQPALPATVETFNGNVTVTVVRSPHHLSCGACVCMGPGRSSLSLYHTHTIF
jgi:hypothetical protein